MPDSGKTVKPGIPELVENNTVDHKIVWKYHMGERIKTERVLQGTLCNLFAVFLKTDAKLLGNVSKCIIQEKASKKMIC